ncbi:hypothetical protein [Luteolibacter soli]|uniref:Uncharacterized protein n=1 Tax=Luteolibacter soli TaxID=3135280 RepID=A0ABU9AVM0_9BACT
MNYPVGTPIQAGDLVWWDEGACVGFIQWIWDEARDGDYSWAKTDGPPLFIANRHPYTPSHEGFGSGMLHDESCLAGEGIGLLNEDELEELRLATALAKARSRSGLNGSFYTVQTRAENCRRVEWIFSVYEDDIRGEEIVIRCDELELGAEDKNEG